MQLTCGFACWGMSFNSKSLHSYRNTRPPIAIHQRFCRAPDVDPVGGEDSFLKNLTYLLYRRSAEGRDRDL